MDQEETIQKLPGVFIAFAEIIYQFELKQKNVWQQVKWHLVHEAKDANPEDTIKNLANMIGVDRNTFADLLQELPPEPKPNNLVTLLTVLKNKCKKNDGDLELSVFMDTAREVMKSSLSPENALNELIKRDTVEITSEGKVRIVSEGLYTDGLSDLYLKIFSMTLLRVTRVMLHNKDATKGHQLFHENIYSTQMPPAKQKEFKAFVKTELKELSHKLNQKIEELEDTDIPVGSYSEVGVSLFETFLLKKLRSKL